MYSGLKAERSSLISGIDFLFNNLELTNNISRDFQIRL